MLNMPASSISQGCAGPTAADGRPAKVSRLDWPAQTSGAHRTLRLNRRTSASGGKWFYRLSQRAAQLDQGPFGTVKPKHDGGDGAANVRTCESRSGQRSNNRRRKLTQERITQEWGHPRRAKLLIIHADDLGMTHSINSAAVKAFGVGAITSGSVMVPCPWFREIAEYASRHAQLDLGVHLTLTSERSVYRWGPISSKPAVPTLLDSDGYFHKNVADAIAQIDPRQAEIEMRAQVTRAYAFGIRPTHLDSHQVIHCLSKPLFESLLRLGREFGIPVLIANGLLERTIGDFLSLLRPSEIVLDSVLSVTPDVVPGRWRNFYADAIRSIPFGISQMIVHPAYDDEEMRAATSDRDTWGAAWRQRDLSCLVSSEFSELLRMNSVQPVSWREVSRALIHAPAHGA
jgi:predicted glycoside hydrolase/deacetylase ChbG (UPF0249 family)